MSGRPDRLPTEASYRYGANEAVSRAKREGKLSRHPKCCIVCGVQGELRQCKSRVRWTIDYHHWSYLPEHWLDVVPVCHSCHRRIHARRIPEPKTGALRPRHAYDSRAHRERRSNWFGALMEPAP